MKKSHGFTVVEIIIVIAIIAILAAITIISYTGITRNATITSMKSDLNDAAQQIQLFQLYSLSGNYPTANNCTDTTSTEICIKANGSNYYDVGSYTYNNSSSPKTYQLDITNGDLKYRITNDSAPVAVTTPVTLAGTDPDNWITIGTQVWAKHNLNVGTMVLGVADQTDNAVLEKYCYDDNPSNCTSYGGLYQWGEAMQYSVSEGAQGICPAGSHIPSDDEWKILEVQLGMSQADADFDGLRVTDIGTKLKPGGSSGLNIPLGGFRDTYRAFYYIYSAAYLFSSTNSSPYAWNRLIYDAHSNVSRGRGDVDGGFSVRCVGN